MKKKIVFGVIGFICLMLMLIFSNPIWSIRVGAILSGCNVDEVMNAEFEICDKISPITTVYRAENTVLPDKLTGSGHQTWYVHSILFINIPYWAGNA